MTPLDDATEPGHAPIQDAVDLLPTDPTLRRMQVHAVLTGSERLGLLEASGLLTHAGTEAMQRVARLAARALRVPVSQVNVVNADAQVPVAAEAASELEKWMVPVGLESSYCQYIVATAAPLVIPDARAHPIVGGSQATIDAGIQAYVGVPLRAPASLGGFILGSVCVVDFEPRRWTDDDVRVLEELASLAVERITWSQVIRATLAGAQSALAVSEGRVETLSEAMGRQLAELEAIYAHAGVGLCVFDTELRWQRINDRLAAMNGYPPKAHLGRSIRELLPDIADGAEPVLRQVLETGEPMLNVELTGETPAHPGERRIWCEHFLPLYDANAAVVGVNVVCEDITERRRAEMERTQLLEAEQAARTDAEAANRVKSEFLATMSHELRTPLNAIGGFAELITEGLYGTVNDEQRQALSRIRRSQQHLLGLINDVLSYTRIDARRVHYELADVAMSDAVSSATVLVMAQAHAKGVTIVVHECGGDVVSRADPAKLQQILLNLLSNAVKFTPTGGSIQLSCALAGRRVVVRVRDDGIGIPADKREAIFEPFVQVDSKLTRTHEGTGLGLAISREFARGMGGELTVESEPAKGSEFTLQLPRGRRTGVMDVIRDAPAGPFR